MAATLTFLTRSRESENFDDLLGAFMAFLRPLGFEHAGMMDMSRNGSNPSPEMSFTTFPPEWVDDFLRHRRYLEDPVCQAALSSKQILVWSIAAAQLGRKPDDPSLHYRRMGLEDGVTIPVHVSRTLHPIIFLGAISRLDIDPDTEAMLTIATNVFASRALQVAGNDIVHPLTEREREVLVWTAQGRSAREIGVILKMSEKTVARHLLNVRAKMKASNTVHAVALALRENLIEY